ncbi:uncharacterized protein LOC125187993 isoform X1 [Salvia hispanica]|uniref:uncharacterized protein LOC125187993 isoform X1 n=2 Tax=Salvia hispanica TaxID=49212 RepID=UPI0020098C09|nr:uncharacterized protein LOC125187993 isoform X1 [Salvia hispanica]XP_047940656.1 uncharacterized protein LOC125187993 isoform X1 [Salvia hispanica]XP_047940657.1 uncharacterized protein LOC125187993 isoform X1 [Salvia hispanica]XP_047940658.1 uncharacterized protein LOC125187993 isoform X1 [Salvia hispanica]XP_047940659.1 uncharacterized protein LOC125187993 isoform X1 [Salvia hispanica]
METDAMSASSKFDISSSSPDRPLYTSVHRGSYGAASLDRSGSFRENLENPLLSSLPNMTRSNSSVTQNDVLNFFHCVRIDPKSMVVDHKLNRPADFKRLASSAVGMPVEDSLPTSSRSKQLTSPSLDDLRRLKSGVRESGTKARERVKIFNDCLSVINKCFPAIPSRKRSRLDTLSYDRSNTLLRIDRAASGVGVGKMGVQNHATANGFELEQQKSEGRTKNTIPSKRTRTSIVDARMDARANNLARPPGAVDKDRDAVRISSSNSVHGEDRTLSIAVEGWENSKMKKKRTRIKIDNGSSSMTTKAVDGYREPKQGTHPHQIPEARSRVADAYGFRSGAANGGVGLVKSEATSQTSSGMRSSMSRTDSENSSILHERREHPNGQEKERVNLKAVNKENSREDVSCSSPTSGSKLNANVRGPRSGLVGGGSKMSQAVQRSVSSNDWDLSNCTNKVSGGLGANSRKRTPSARSSSPVANWAQRPQKISRTARRTSLLPVVSGNDEDPVMDAASDMMVNERCFPAGSPKQTKIKGDNIFPAALFESDGPVAAEIKSRNKNKKCDELDEKSVQNVQKISALLLPPRKNKAVNADDHGDGVRRQGRTGRGFTSSRSLFPLSVEKLGNVGTTKQIRSSRLGLDKTESRAGRPPTRKLSDRKAYTRQKHIAINTVSDLLVGADDGHEELLAAANAVANTAQALTSPFWKKMEPLFHFITDVHISYLKDQINSGITMDTPAPVQIDTASCILVPDYGSNEFGRGETKARCLDLSPEHVATGVKKSDEISMYQRIIAALIPEEEHDLRYDAHESSFEIEKDLGSDTVCSHTSPSCDPSGCPTFNGYDSNSNGRSFYELEQNIMSIPGMGFPNCDHLQDGLHTDQLIPSTICSEYQYQNMSINERLIMEVHSIGIYPDLVSYVAQSGDEISGDITRLDEKYQEQVSLKKSLLGKLLCSATDAKELQQKDFEERALNKLVGMAYEKYMSCCGPNAHGMKSASGKMAKQVALAFVKRTMERYREFEETGKSCFDDPLYKDIFLSGVSFLFDGQPLNSSTDNESEKLHLGASGSSIEARTSAPVGPQQSPSSNNQDTYSSEVFPSNNLGSEQVNRKEDSWSNRVKRREVLLDNVGGIISTGLGGSLSSSAKGKRSERDREGKGNNREAFSKNGMVKNSRTVSASVKGDRKSKARTKQKTAHLSASINGSLGNTGEQENRIFSAMHKSSENSQSNSGKDNNNHSNDMLEEPIDLSGLQLPDMDDLGVTDDLGGQGEDLGSWFMNIEDDGLHDNDCIGGLGIPMDDLAELNMMV